MFSRVKDLCQRLKKKNNMLYNNNTLNMYDYFEDIVCINLDISIERRKHAEYYFTPFNI